jgi:hypothetical protein
MGETPGTNPLEVTGEQGKLVLEDNKLTFTRNEIPMSKWLFAISSGQDNR